MIKNTARWILGCFFVKYRQPLKTGNIQIKDAISHETLTMLWRPESLMETQFFRYGLYGTWERHSLRIWAHLSSDAQEILDIGANTGVYSLLARKNNPHAIIVAVEPVPINADVLQRNVIANAANVIVERIAMSDTDGEAVMHMLKGQLNYMTSVNDNRYALHPEITGTSEVVPIRVPIGTWSGLRAKHSLNGPDLIKIDVEGHEVAVLRSLQAHIRNRRPTILVEIIGAQNATAINTMLGGIDYVLFSIDETARKGVVVKSVWDNDHQNFLICRREIADTLKSKGLVIGLEETRE
jgi:FkbM family methyltransferase